MIWYDYMVEQGFEFYLDDDQVYFEKLDEHKFTIGFPYDAPFFYNSDLLYTKLYINNILFTDDNDALEKMELHPIKIDSNKLEENKIEIVVNLDFNLEERDHIKILYGFDTDRREGQINLLL